MFVLCVLYSKDKRQSQDNQDREVRRKDMPLDAWMFVFVVSRDKTCTWMHGCLCLLLAETKNAPVCMDVCVCCK
jgi:hypothetical protein